MSDVREIIQQQAKQAWLDSSRKNTIIAATGIGKSKIAIDIIKEVKPRSILLLTNSEELRDKNWKAEFEKFDALDYWNVTQSECYQTMYSRSGEWDMIIQDEIDFCCSEQYGKCLLQDNLKSNTVLGLTGFITEEKEHFLEQFYPICFRAETGDLQEQGLLNKSEFILIYYPLNKEKTQKQKKKDGTTFMVSENDTYKYYDKMFNQAMIAKTSIEKKYRLRNINYEKEDDWMKADWKFKIMAVKRKSLLNNSISSVQVTKNLIDNIHQETGNKIVIFSAITKQSDFFPNPYHGKSEDEHVLEKLNSGEINTAAVVKKVSRGVNLVGVNYLIYESYDGSETDFTQKHGRGLRLKPDQTLKAIILLPMFEESHQANGKWNYTQKTTQASNWATKMMKGFDTSNARTIQLDHTLKLKDGIRI